MEADPQTSPYIDAVRQIIGAEYEYILYSTLRLRRIPFLSEDDLR